jgi:hypothetical protein
MTTLQDQTKPSYYQLMQMLLDSKAQLAAAKANGNGLKVTPKGGVSMYGLGRFPVTLYRSQWESLIDRIPELKVFITDNADKLAAKE